MKLFCKKCQSEKVVSLSKAGPHIKANCFTCGSYIKFITQTQEAKEEFEQIHRKDSAISLFDEM